MVTYIIDSAIVCNMRVGMSWGLTFTIIGSALFVYQQNPLTLYYDSTP